MSLLRKTGFRIVDSDGNILLYDYSQGESSTRRLTFSVGASNEPYMEYSSTLGGIAFSGTIYSGGYEVLTTNSTISVGDADTLDSLDSTQFLRSDANDSFSGTLTSTISAGSTALDLATNDGYAQMRVIRNATADTTNDDGMWIGYANSSSGITRIYGGGATSGGIVISGSGVNDVTIAGSTAWHAGNDGSGSGLDADLLDGVQASQFLRSDTSDTMSGDLTVNNLRALGNSNAVDLGNSGAEVDINYRGQYSTWQVGVNQNYGNGSWYWYRDGSGYRGGIDTSANMFAEGSMRAPIFYDKNNTSYYADPASTSNINALTMAGNLTIVGANAPNNFAYLNIGYSGAGQTRAIDIQGNWSVSESKAITWTHGSASTNIVGQIDVQYNGLGSRMRFGKLYHGGDTNVYTMELISQSTTSANLEVSGTVDATEFRDSSNTGYYVNPASTSNISALTVNGFFLADGGSRVVVQNGVNGGANRGIYFWTGSDSNWTHYMAESGAGRSIDGGTAPTSIDGRTSHHIRYRVAGGTTNGHLWENNSNVTLMSLTGDTGNLYTRGNIYANNSTSNRVFADNYHPNADKWTTARTLSLTGDVTGSVSWDGSGNASMTTAVANDSHTHDGRYYTETESDDRFAGSEFVADAYIDFTVNGDANTYYPVSIQGAGHFAFNMYSISRGYNWTAPDTWNTSTHKGGLTLTWQYSGDSFWGGNDHDFRIIKFDETYTTMVTKMAGSVGGGGTHAGVVVWLRGGGALYRFHGPQGFKGDVNVHLTSVTASNGTVFAPISYSSTEVNNTINSRYPIRGESSVYDGLNKVWHAGNDGSGSGLDADLLDGYHSAENGASVNIRTQSNGYLNVNNWIQVGASGIFSSSVNGAHLYPNQGSTYGTWQVNGSRNGWAGFYFNYAARKPHVMFDSDANGGFFVETGSRWPVYYHYGNDCLGIGGTVTASGYKVYLNGSFHAGNNDINYVNQLHFNDDVRFYDDGNDSYLNFKYGDASAGGIKVWDGNNNFKGYFYADTGGIGILPSDGSWGIQITNSQSIIHHRLDTPIIYDQDNTGYYVDLTNGGKLLGNFEFAANSTSTLYHVSSIELRESNFTANATATPPQLGFHWGGVVASSIALESSGRIAIRNNPGTGYENFIAATITSTGTVDAPQFRDSNNTGYFVDPASTSILSSIFTGGIVVDNGTSSTLSVKCDDAGLALIRANGDGQGTGAIEVGQSDSYGGGISYNGDGSPAFVNGETSDAITFYRMEAGVRVEVFYYPYNSNTVTFNSTPYVGGSAIWHAGNDGSGSGLDADLLDGLSPATAATGNTIVQREANGHIYGNYILGTYFNASSGNSENPTIGQIWTQSTADNYLRKSTPAHLISQLSLVSKTHSGSDFANGTIIQTNIPSSATNGASFVLEVTGKSYSSNPCFNFMVQGYLYNNGIISTSGTNISGFGPSEVKIWNNNGYLAFWFARISYWNSFEARCRNAGGSVYNEVTSITNGSDPGASASKYTIVYMRNSVTYNLNSNAGEVYGSQFTDSDNTSYYVNPAGYSKLDRLHVAGSAPFSGSSAVYSDERMALSVGDAGLEAIVYQSLYNSSSYPDYGMVFVHGDGTNRNVWSISPDGPAKGNLLGFLYDLNSTNIHAGTYRFWLDGSGNSYSQVSSRAQIFYDSNNTAYNVNPASTSSLYQVDLKNPAKLINYVNSTGNAIYQQIAGTGASTLYWTHGTSSANLMYLDSSGNLTAIGNVTAYSDIKLKDDIQVIDNAIDKVKQIRGVTFTRNDMHDDKRQTGVIAQEVEQVLPEVVTESDYDGIKSVAYGNMVGLLIEAIKEQQAQIEALQEQINGLTK